MHNPGAIEAKLPITVLIACRNEEANMPKCLAALTPAARVLVVDSASRDRTAEIAIAAGAEVVQFHYAGGFPKKRQWALQTQNINTPWVLLLDADEVVPPALWDDIRTAVTSEASHDAYVITKGFHFLGRRFRHGGFSFGAVLLFKTGRARFEHIFDDPPTALDMEVHERLIVDGSVGRLSTAVIHEDFKGLEAYIERHNKYSTWEARARHEFLTTGRWGRETIRPHLFGNTQERRRFLKLIAVRTPLEPLLWFLYHYVVRLGCLEGRPGLIASQIRGSYIEQVRAKVYELHRRRQTEQKPLATKDLA